MGNTVVVPSYHDWYTQPLRRMKINLIGHLDAGQFFLVFEGKDSQNQDVVIKAYEYNEPLQRLEKIRYSRRYFKRLSEYSADVPGIVSFSYVVQDNMAFLIRPKFEKSFNFAEFCSYQQPILEPIEKLFIFYQIYTIIKSLHGIDLVHGDLKPSNIFVNGHNLDLYIVDPAPFKPNFIYESSLHMFYHYFTTNSDSGCYLAPERIIGIIQNNQSKSLQQHQNSKKTKKNDDQNSKNHNEKDSENMKGATTHTKDNTNDDSSDEHIHYDSNHIDMKMSDVFSFGCIIAFLYLDGEHIFDLSKLHNYANGKIDIRKDLERINDEKIIDIIMGLISLDIEERRETMKNIDHIFEYFFPIYSKLFCQYRNDQSFVQQPQEHIPKFLKVNNDLSENGRIFLFNFFFDQLLKMDQIQNIIFSVQEITNFITYTKTPKELNDQEQGLSTKEIEQDHFKSIQYLENGGISTTIKMTRAIPLFLSTIRNNTGSPLVFRQCMFSILDIFKTIEQFPMFLKDYISCYLKIEFDKLIILNKSPRLLPILANIAPYFVYRLKRFVPEDALLPLSSSFSSVFEQGSTPYIFSIFTHSMITIAHLINNNNACIIQKHKEKKLKTKKPKDSKAHKHKDNEKEKSKKDKDEEEHKEKDHKSHKEKKKDKEKTEDNGNKEHEEKDHKDKKKKDEKNDDKEEKSHKEKKKLKTEEKDEKSHKDKKKDKEKSDDNSDKEEKSHKSKKKEKKEGEDSEKSEKSHKDKKKDKEKADNEHDKKEEKVHKDKDEEHKEKGEKDHKDKEKIKDKDDEHKEKGEKENKEKHKEKKEDKEKHHDKHKEEDNEGEKDVKHHEVKDKKKLKDEKDEKNKEDDNKKESKTHKDKSKDDEKHKEKKKDKDKEKDGETHKEKKKDKNKEKDGETHKEKDKKKDKDDEKKKKKDKDHKEKHKEKKKDKEKHHKKEEILNSYESDDDIYSDEEFFEEFFQEKEKEKTENNEHIVIDYDAQLFDSGFSTFNSFFFYILSVYNNSNIYYKKEALKIIIEFYKCSKYNVEDKKKYNQIFNDSLFPILAHILSREISFIKENNSRKEIQPDEYELVAEIFDFLTCLCNSSKEIYSLSDAPLDPLDMLSYSLGYQFYNYALDYYNKATDSSVKYNAYQFMKTLSIQIKDFILFETFLSDSITSPKRSMNNSSDSSFSKRISFMNNGEFWSFQSIMDSNNKIKQLPLITTKNYGIQVVRNKKPLSFSPRFIASFHAESIPISHILCTSGICVVIDKSNRVRWISLPQISERSIKEEPKNNIDLSFNFLFHNERFVNNVQQLSQIRSSVLRDKVTAASMMPRFTSPFNSTSFLLGYENGSIDQHDLSTCQKSRIFDGFNRVFLTSRSSNMSRDSISVPALNSTMLNTAINSPNLNSAVLNQSSNSNNSPNSSSSFFTDFVSDSAIVSIQPISENCIVFANKRGSVRLIDTRTSDSFLSLSFDSNIGGVVDLCTWNGIMVGVGFQAGAISMIDTRMFQPFLFNVLRSNSLKKIVPMNSKSDQISSQNLFSYSQSSSFLTLSDEDEQVAEVYREPSNRVVLTYDCGESVNDDIHKIRTAVPFAGGAIAVDDVSATFITLNTSREAVSNKYNVHQSRRIYNEYVLPLITNESDEKEINLSVYIPAKSRSKVKSVHMHSGRITCASSYHDRNTNNNSIISCDDLGFVNLWNVTSG